MMPAAFVRYKGNSSFRCPDRGGHSRSVLSCDALHICARTVYHPLLKYTPISAG